MLIFAMAQARCYRKIRINYLNKTPSHQCQPLIICAFYQEKRCSFYQDKRYSYSPQALPGRKDRPRAESIVPWTSPYNFHTSFAPASGVRFGEESRNALHSRRQKIRDLHLITGRLVCCEQHTDRSRSFSPVPGQFGSSTSFQLFLPLELLCYSVSCIFTVLQTCTSTCRSTVQRVP